MAAKQHKRNGNFQFWTHENHAIETTTIDLLIQRLQYIQMNPARAEIVQNPEDFLYSSARNFAEVDYLIEIDLI